MSVTARGGYQILDLQEKVIPWYDANKGVTIPGIYAACADAINSRRKPILIENVNIDGDLIIPFYLNLWGVDNNDGFTIPIPQSSESIYIVIATDDSVTLKSGSIT